MVNFEKLWRNRNEIKKERLSADDSERSEREGRRIFLCFFYNEDSSPPSTSSGVSERRFSMKIPLSLTINPVFSWSIFHNCWKYKQNSKNKQKGRSKAFFF